MAFFFICSLYILYDTFLYLIFDDFMTLKQNSFKPYEIVKALLLFPVIEEILFRKYFLTSLLNYYNEKKAMIASSLGFAICHLFTDTGLLQVFIFSYFLSWLYINSNSIILCIILHSCVNILSLNYYNSQFKVFVMEYPILVLLVSLPLCFFCILTLRKQFDETRR